MENIVFGPVISRRFGVSLGVDLSPSMKQCNFDCLYCELNGKKAQGKMDEVLEVEILIQKVCEALEKNPQIDVLTITANGEPTLYPYLYDFMKAIKPFVPKDVSTLILSNGSRFGEKEVQKALHLFDIVKFSLDGADTKSFMRVDRPYKDIKLDKLLKGIGQFASEYRGKLVAEVLLVKGVNDKSSNIKAIVEFLKHIHINRVDLGTVDRPPAYKANSLEYEKLLELAREFDGMYVSLPQRKENLPLICGNYSQEMLLELIARRPISISEAPSLFDKSTLKNIQELLEDKKIFVKKVVNLEFYTISN